MTQKKKFVKLVKKSRKEIGDNYDKLSQEVDNDIKEKLSEEQYKVYTAAIGDSEEEEQKIIAEIGKDRYFDLLNELNEITSELLSNK